MPADSNKDFSYLAIELEDIALHGLIRARNTRDPAPYSELCVPHKLSMLSLGIWAYASITWE